MKTRPKTTHTPTGVRTDFIVCIHFLTYHQYTHLKSDTTAATDSAERPVYALASIHGSKQSSDSDSTRRGGHTQHGTAGSVLETSSYDHRTVFKIIFPQF